MRKLVFLTAFVVLSCFLAFHEAKRRRKFNMICGRLSEPIKKNNITGRHVCTATKKEVVATPNGTRIHEPKPFFVACTYKNENKNKQVTFIKLSKKKKIGKKKFFLKVASINSTSPRIDYIASPILRVFGEIKTGESSLFASWKTINKTLQGKYICTLGLRNKKRAFTRRRRLFVKVKVLNKGNATV